MNTIEAMKGHEQTIIHAFGLPPITGNKHYKECPICGGKNKFRMSYHNGSVGYICTCGNGSLIKLIMEITGRLFKDVAAEIDKLIGNSFKLENKPVIKCDLKDRFISYDILRGSIAQEYLNNRGVYELPKRGMRFCKGINDEQGYLPAIISVASDDYNRACYEHRTFLNGGFKANVTTQKKMFKVAEGNNISVKLFDHADVLGVSEGLETALSAHQLYKVPTWSTLNSGFLKTFKAPTLHITFVMPCSKRPIICVLSSFGVLAVITSAATPLLLNSFVT